MLLYALTHKIRQVFWQIYSAVKLRERAPLAVPHLLAPFSCSFCGCLGILLICAKCCGCHPPALSVGVGLIACERADAGWRLMWHKRDCMVFCTGGSGHYNTAHLCAAQLGNRTSGRGAHAADSRALPAAHAAPGSQRSSQAQHGLPARDPRSSSCRACCGHCRDSVLVRRSSSCGSCGSEGSVWHGNGWKSVCFEIA